MTEQVHFYSGRVVKLTRLQNTAYGNPRYRFRLETGSTFMTEPDSQVAAQITETEHGPGHWLKFTLDSKQRIVKIESLGRNGFAVAPDPTPEEAAAEALLEAADDFPTDIPGHSLVVEWLKERAEKYHTGELVIP